MTTSVFCTAITAWLLFDMPNTQIEITGLKELTANVRRFPDITRARLQDAVVAGAAEVQKYATRENVPWKTGNLVISFGNGVVFGDLFARIAPTAYYAVFVHEGTERIKKPNRFMPRIAEAAKPGVQAFFTRAVRLITEDVTRL